MAATAVPAAAQMGRIYQETTPAMLARVTAALDDRLGVAERVAARAPEFAAVDGGESR